MLATNVSIDDKNIQIILWKKNKSLFFVSTKKINKKTEFATENVASVGLVSTKTDVANL